MSGWLGALARLLMVLALGAMVTAVVWGVANAMGDDIDVDQGVDLSLITNETTCELAGGSWSGGATPPCT
ncbi:MAG: hypothetical protein F4Z41_06370 [Acidimicrobiia bacterium]|nr:hypothetical protein [bacterium]MXW68949.1 hypothetical protein [Acidimicrobiia bacterium]MDE0673815.1 hypothetical protein [bacterium]MXX01993.1 hypothetical protein [Acidimicrobiia bacterium]MXX45815.1 hypothetical protein [Acidimicrobiia bacterium]